jgi:hypothetical protein
MAAAGPARYGLGDLAVRFALCALPSRPPWVSSRVVPGWVVYELHLSETSRRPNGDTVTETNAASRPLLGRWVALAVGGRPRARLGPVGADLAGIWLLYR